MHTHTQHRCSYYVEDTNCTVITRLQAWITNESGATQVLGEDARLEVTASDVAGRPIPGIVKAHPHHVVACKKDGVLRADVTLTIAKPDGRPVPVRLTLRGAGPISLQLRGTGKDTGRTISVPAVAVQSTVVYVHPGAVPAASVAGAAASDAVDGDASISESECEVQLVSVAPAATLRILERHMKVSPGFGSIVWDCALAMTHVLADNPWLVSGRRVVDLGSGTGVVGMAAAALGAHVCLTDLEGTLPLTRLNASSNEACVRTASGSLTAAELLWGEDAHIHVGPVEIASKGKGRGLKPLVVDGRVAAPVDVILASEVAYRGELFEPLIDTMTKLIGARKATPTARPEPDAAGAEAVPPKDPCRVRGVAVSHEVHLDDAPVILLGARHRASCELQDFFDLLVREFRVTQLLEQATEPVSAAPASAAAKSRPGKKGTAADVRRCVVASRGLAEFTSASAAMSKTSYAPMLFVLQPRAG